MYLSKAINNGFGCSYSQLINRYRIEYLIKEAQRTGENIAAIATRCQFWSRSTFFDVFRNHTGMTPHRYMEANRSKTKSQAHAVAAGSKVIVVQR